MKKVKIYFTDVVFPVYGNYQVRVVFTSDIVRAMLKWAETRACAENVESSDLAHAIHVEDRPKSYIFLPRDADAGCIVHECWHVIRRMLVDWCGAELENEIVAYHLGYLTKKVVDFAAGIR